MSEPYKTELMSQEAKTARLLMNVQAAVGLLGVVLYIGLIGTQADPRWILLLPPSSILILAPLVLLIVLAVKCSSRKKWVRITAFAAEGFVGLVGLVFLFSSWLGALPGLILGGAVIFWLTRPAARAWFNR
jgi:hypothetical protein